MGGVDTNQPPFEKGFHGKRGPKNSVNKNGRDTEVDSLTTGHKKSVLTREAWRTQRMGGEEERVEHAL